MRLSHGQLPRIVSASRQRRTVPTLPGVFGGLVVEPFHKVLGLLLPKHTQREVKNKE